MASASSSLSVQIIWSVIKNYTISTTFLTSICGLIGNLLNIHTFTRLKIFRNNPCIFYLTFESIINTIVLLFQLILRLLNIIYGSDLTPYSSMWCKFRTIISQTLLLFSLSIVCSSAVDQFFSTHSLVYIRQMSTIKLARYLIMSSFSFSLIHSLTCGVFFYARIPTDCIASSSILVNYYTYFFYPILSGLLPMFISGLFSLLAYRNVRRIIRRQLPIVRRRLDRQLTKFVLLRVLFLIILFTPFVIYRIYIINATTNPLDYLSVAIDRLMSAIIGSLFGFNYAISFYIFFFSSSRYRKQVNYVLNKKYWKQWCYSNRNQIDPTNLPTPSTIELE